MGCHIHKNMTTLRDLKMIHTATNGVFDVDKALTETAGWFKTNRDWELEAPNLGALLEFHRPEGLERYLCLDTFADLDENDRLKVAYKKALDMYIDYYSHLDCDCHPEGMNKRDFDWREANRMLVAYSVNRATWSMSCYFLASYYRRSFLLRDALNPNLLMDVVQDAKIKLGVTEFVL